MRLIAAISLAVFSMQSLACDINFDTFDTLIRNAEYYESDSFSEPPAANITEKEFYQTVEKVRKIYTPHFNRRGWDFRVVASWKDPTRNASAAKDKNIRYLYLSGGYARERFMTRDAYLTVVCHEIGHHLGGFPLKQMWWATMEGQADYYATLKCMKLLLKFDPQNKKVATSLKLPQEIKNLCRSQYKGEDDYYICLRSAKAAEDYGLMSQAMAERTPKKIVNLLTPDLTKPEWSYEHHPEAQCRVDTKLQGALCNVDEKIIMNDKDERQGACHQLKGHVLGVRPSCWFISKLF